MILTVIIPTRNRSKTLSWALESITKQTLHPELFEVIVVDNGSTDYTKNVANSYKRKIQNIRYYYDESPGLHVGRHKGLMEALADILVFIDDDIIADKKWLATIVKAFRDPLVHMVGGRYLPMYEIEPPLWLDAFWNKHKYGRWCGYLSLLDFGDQIREIDPVFIWGLCFAIRKDTLLKIGGFHPDAFPWGLHRFRGDGETAVSIKARELGFKAIYHPEVLLYHRVPAERLTIEYFEKRAFLQGISKSYTEIRSMGGLGPPPNNSKRLNWKEPLCGLKRKIKKVLKGSNPQSEDPYNDIKARVRRAHNDGYQFHQKEVLRDPELLKWVLKKDYWDCRLPINSK